MQWIAIDMAVTLRPLYPLVFVFSPVGFLVIESLAQFTKLLLNKSLFFAYSANWISFLLVLGSQESEVFSKDFVKNLLAFQ